MFSLFRSVAALLFLAAPLVFANEDSECQATYRVNFGANYPDNVSVKCTVEDMDLITKVIHSVVELDAIASQISKSVPDFVFTSEKYSEDVIIDNTGLLATPPDAEEITKHMTDEDVMQDLLYETGLDDNGGRRLQRDQDAPLEFAKPVLHADPQHRQAQLMDCDLLEHCTTQWCCQVCGYCARRRKLSPVSSLRQRATPEDEKEPEDDQDFLHRVELHEKRVSAELLKKFRYLMRKEAIPCLGNFWELQVFFKMVV